MSADNVTERGGMGRRGALSMGLRMLPTAAMAAVVAAKPEWADNLQRVLEVAPPQIQEAPNPGGKPHAIFTVPLMIFMSEGLNLRSYPAIPKSGRPRILWPNVDNWIPWARVERVNGVAVGSARQFIIEGAEAVMGENTYKYSRRLPVDAAEEWIRLLVSLKGEGLPRYAFLSYGVESSFYTGTDRYIQPIGAYSASSVVLEGAQEDGSGYRLKDGQHLSKEGLGFVTPVLTKYEYYERWRIMMERKMDGMIPVHDYHEQRNDEVEVVSGFQPVQNLIRLISFPDTDEHLYRTFGFVSPGTRIRDVIRVGREWAVFRRKGLQGEVQNVYSQPIEVDPDRVMVIAGPQISIAH